MPSSATIAPVSLFVLLVVILPVTIDALSNTAPTEVLPDANGVTSLTLTVAPATISVDGAVTFTTRAWHYKGSALYPGPTIRVRAGGRLLITLVNGMESSADIDDARMMNQYRNVNLTNLHTHGLHVSPEIDNIFARVHAGNSSLFNLSIPSDHAPGMHWYHTHVHGASTLHIMGGLVGALFVEPPATLAEFANMTQDVLVMTRLQFAAEKGTNGSPTQDCGQEFANFDPFKKPSMYELINDTASRIPLNAKFKSGVPTNFMLVNGRFNPTHTIQSGERRLFQIVYAAGEGNPLLRIQTGNRSGDPNACTIHVVGWDGVYISGVPRLQTSIQLIPATRVAAIVTCSGATAGTKYFVNAVDGSDTFTVLTLVISGTAASTPSLPSIIAVRRPVYLTDLRSKNATTTWHMHFSQGGRNTCLFHIGMGANCNAYDVAQALPGSTDKNCPFLEFPGELGYNRSKHRIYVTVGDIVEFVVHGLGKSPHPLHIHVNHFQLVSYTSLTNLLNFSDWMTIGDWRDTVPALDGVLKVRFAADTFAGEAVVHCHVLSHEDQGLMATFLIQNATSGPKSTTAPTTKMTATSSKPTTRKPTTSTPLTTVKQTTSKPLTTVKQTTTAPTQASSTAKPQATSKPTAAGATPTPKPTAPKPPN